MDLKSLEILDLGTNNLTRIEQSTLDNLANLNFLRLDHNKLVNLEPFALSNSNLEEIRLEYNQLISIDKNIFENLINLEFVFLESNPISEKQPDYVIGLCWNNKKCRIVI